MTQGGRFVRQGAAIATVALVAVLGALAGGCASSGVAAQQRDLEAQLRARGFAPGQVIIPFQLDEEMKRWVHSAVPERGRPEAKLHTLLEALVDKAGLQLEYESDRTATAQEVFASRRANCLAFANLFLGMAREIGVPVYFVEVRDLQSFAREGDLVIVSGHVTAAYGPPEGRLLLDFTLGQTVKYRQVSAISDLRAIAMYYSNLGARLLREGQVEKARTWLETAVRVDPELPGAWVNLGVARRRGGDLAGAELAYRRALEADPATLSAYQNLAALLRRQGKDAEAAELLALTDRKDNRNPFSYLDLGDLALRHGRTQEAGRFYHRALRLSREDPEPYAALGLLALAGGHPQDARRWLRKARQQTGPPGLHLAELEAQLAHPAAGEGAR
ncbi:MAG: tetratricopeptide repeat protein [Acidobacteriota bacterium]